MTYEEAIKRLRQETCPATYNKDFDKEACIRVIEERVRKQNEILRILKKYGLIHVGCNKKARWIETKDRLYNLTEDEYEAVKGWAEGK